MDSHWKSVHWEETCNQCLKWIRRHRGEQIREDKEEAEIQTGRLYNGGAMSDHSTGPRRGPKWWHRGAECSHATPTPQQWQWLMTEKGQAGDEGGGADARLPLGMWCYLKPICLLQEIRKRWQSPAASVGEPDLCGLQHMNKGSLKCSHLSHDKQTLILTWTCVLSYGRLLKFSLLTTRFCPRCLYATPDIQIDKQKEVQIKHW